MTNILRLSIILAIVTLIAAFVLAEIYSVTKPKIELQKKAKTREALNYVIPEANFEPVTRDVPVKDGDGNVLYEKEEIQYYRAYAEGDTNRLIGYAFKAEGNGYSSVIETMVGIDTNGVIQRIDIVSQQETPGLGAKCEDKHPFEGKSWTTRQFKDKTAENLKVDKDGGEIVSITGATITSRTITNSIRKELNSLKPKLNLSSTNQLEEKN